MSLTEDDKLARPQEYGFNPVSRRWVKRTSDVWLRLVKSGVVDESPEYLSDIAAARREAARKKNDRAGGTPARPSRPACMLFQQPAPAPAPVAAPAPAPVPAPETRAELRDRIVKIAVSNVKHLADCDADSMEHELKRLLEGRAPRYAPPAKPARPHATHARHFVDSEEESTDVTDY